MKRADENPQEVEDSVPLPLDRELYPKDGPSTKSVDPRPLVGCDCSPEDVFLLKQAAERAHWYSVHKPAYFGDPAYVADLRDYHRSMLLCTNCLDPEVLEAFEALLEEHNIAFE